MFVGAAAAAWASAQRNPPLRGHWSGCASGRAWSTLLGLSLAPSVSNSTLDRRALSFGRARRHLHLWRTARPHSCASAKHLPCQGLQVRPQRKPQYARRTRRKNTCLAAQSHHKTTMADKWRVPQRLSINPDRAQGNRRAHAARRQTPKWTSRRSAKRRRRDAGSPSSRRRAPRHRASASSPSRTPEVPRTSTPASTNSVDARTTS